MVFTGKSQGDVDGNNPVYIFKRLGGRITDGQIGLVVILDWLKVVLQILEGISLIVTAKRSGVVNLFA